MKKGFSKVGIVLAAAGSAVGLGNIWKFPYMIGENGGAAFLIIYLLCVLFFGIPIMSAEFYIGRKGLHRWGWMRWLSMAIATFFFSFYLVVTGWCFQYMYLSITDLLSGHSASELSTLFTTFTSSTTIPMFWMGVGVLLTAAIELMGVKDGIERMSKILMPILFCVLLLMIGRGLTMERSYLGMRFLLYPDFSKITPQLILNATGQCFFSLSIGVGALATYAGFMDKDQSLVSTSYRVILLDTLVAILAGMAIFPAVFSLGINPTQGPELVFVTLPMVFDSIPGGHLFEILFFLLLSIAAITSTISLLETQLNFWEMNAKMSRPKGILISSLLVLVLGALAILIHPFFNLLDELVSKYLLPAGGLIFAIYVGWIANKDDVCREMNVRIKGVSIGKFLFVLIRYSIPPTIILVFLNGLQII